MCLNWNFLWSEPGGGWKMMKKSPIFDHFTPKFLHKNNEKISKFLAFSAKVGFLLTRHGKYKVTKVTKKQNQKIQIFVKKEAKKV